MTVDEIAKTELSFLKKHKYIVFFLRIQENYWVGIVNTSAKQKHRARV